MGKDVEGKWGSGSLRAQGTQRSRAEDLTNIREGSVGGGHGEGWVTLVTRVSL